VWCHGCVCIYLLYISQINHLGTTEYTGRTGGTFGCFQCNAMARPMTETAAPHLMYPLQLGPNDTPISDHQWLHTARQVDDCRREVLSGHGRRGCKAAFTDAKKATGFDRVSPMSPLIHSGTSMCQSGDCMHGKKACRVYMTLILYCSPACSLTYLLACLLAFLFSLACSLACLLARSLARLLVYSLACLLACLLTGLLA
jgi:hypothetical protein